MQGIEKPVSDEISELKRRLAETEAALNTLLKQSPNSDGPGVQADTTDTTPGMESYRSLFENMTEGFALHEIVCDAQGIPCDYTFIELNPAFERMTGIKRQNAIGMLASQILPGLEPFWIETCGQVALTGQPAQFDQYIQTLGKFYRVYAFRPVPGQFATIFMDITDAKQVELGLQEIADKYATLFNSPSDGILIHDLDGVILEVNDAYCRMSGYTRDELIHMPFSQLEASKTPAEIGKHIQKLIELRGHDQFESTHRRKDDSLFDVDITASYFDRDGGRIAIFLRDITERKRQEEHRAYLASFPERNPSPIVEVDLEGKIHYINPTALKLFPDIRELGFKHPWLVGLDSISDRLHQDMADVIVRDVAIRNKCFQQELKLITPGDLIRIYGFEITGRKHAEAALRERERQLSRAQEISHVGSWELDLIENHLTWSDETYRIFGYTPQEFAATYEAFLEAVHPDDRAAVDEAYSGSIRDGRDTYEIEHRLMKRSSGEVRIVHEKCMHFKDETGKVIRSEGMVHDITERKLAEQALQRAHAELELRVQERTEALNIANSQLRTKIEENEKSKIEIETNLQELQVIEEELRNNNELLLETQKVLEDERQRYQDLFDFAPDGYVVTDKNGKIIEVNQIAAKLFGVSYKNLIGKPVQVFIAMEDRPSFREILAKFPQKPEVKLFELKLHPRVGPEITSSVTVAKAKTQEGEETFRWTMRDISERKRAEEIIRQNSLRDAVLSDVSQSLAEASLDEKAIQDIVVKTTARLVGDSCVIAIPSKDGLWLDPCSWHHNKPEALTLMNTLYSQAHHQGVDGPVEQVFRNSRPLLIADMNSPAKTAQISPAYGQYIEEVGVSSLLIVPLRIGNQTIGTLGLTRDTGGRPYTSDDQALVEILAIRTAQSIYNARLYQELQESLRNEVEVHDQLVRSEKFAAVGRLLASITHEINNPLQTIKNCLYLSREDTAADSPISDYLRIATTETDRLSNLVAQLRDIYRPPAQGLSQPVNLPALIDEVRILLVRYLQEKHVSWEVTPPDAEQISGFRVEGVPDQLKQVFLNISLNAMDAMEPNGGKIMIRFNLPTDGNDIGISFRDTGPGLPAEVKNKLFEPFITTKEKGLGLGLTICFDIIQKHHGHIEVESNPGEGAAFTIWLPATRETHEKNWE